MFLSETNFFYILLTIIPYAPDRREWGQKVCFFSEYLCFLFGRCVESTRTDPRYPPIYFLPMLPESSSCFGMVLDEGGGGPSRIEYDSIPKISFGRGARNTTLGGIRNSRVLFATCITYRFLPRVFFSGSDCNTILECYFANILSCVCHF